MYRRLCLLALIATAASLTGCGNKGPLYLPRPAASAPAAAGTVATPATAASAPAPAASVVPAASTSTGP